MHSPHSSSRGLVVAVRDVRRRRPVRLAAWCRVRDSLDGPSFCSSRSPSLRAAEPSTGTATVMISQRRSRVDRNTHMGSSSVGGGRAVPGSPCVTIPPTWCLVGMLIASVPLRRPSRTPSSDARSPAQSHPWSSSPSSLATGHRSTMMNAPVSRGGPRTPAVSRLARRNRPRTRTVARRDPVWMTPRWSSAPGRGTSARANCWWTATRHRVSRLSHLDPPVRLDLREAGLRAARRVATWKLGSKW